MKNNRALLSLVLLAMLAPRAAGQAAAEGGTRSSAGDLPPALDVREADSLSPSPLDEAAESAPALEPIAESIAAGNAESPLDGSILGEPLRMLQGCPSYFESSGTWLERGFWYAEMDYLFLNRGWDRKGLQLAFESTTGNVPTGPIPVVGANELRIRGERPGGEGVGRLTLGRFLFRDASNRDHSMEASWLGGGEWSQTGSLDAATNVGLEIPVYIDRVNRSFNGARSMAFGYDSELNTVEANYVVKQRMHRDQMVMEPSGQWVRKATPTRTYSFLAGLRYANHRENLDWTATEIQVQANPTLREDGFYNVMTENNMLGTQLGASMSRETARWSLSAAVKGGPMWNRIDLNSQFQVGETVPLNGGTTNSTEDDLSFFGEAQLLAKWHLRPNVSLRAGLEILFIDSIAIAPHQVNFIPGGYPQIAASGDSVYMGTSFGLESYW